MNTFNKVDHLRLAMAQINPTVGDLAGNSDRILRYIERAQDVGADLVSFPELAITGYPPEDLLLKRDFIQSNINSLNKVAEECRHIAAIVGFVDRQEDIYNAAALLYHGQISAVYHKNFLPNYGVFDENRYFQAGHQPLIFTLKGVTIGINICEDIWYPGGPMMLQTLLGNAELITNISASPYHVGKRKTRMQMLATRAQDYGVIISYNNMVGGQDELVFDGGSVVIDQDGDIIAHGKLFEEDLIITDLDVEAVFRKRLRDPRRRQEKLNYLAQEPNLIKIELPQDEIYLPKPPIIHEEPQTFSSEAEIYKALELGTRDYIHKNGFEKVVIGLSGGIDSALTAVIAVDALGCENVVGVCMPSHFSSSGSLIDAKELSANLRINLINLPISSIQDNYLDILAEPFKGFAENEAEENLQARIRGNLLMALSNKFNWLVLNTGNKSEVSVGYCTLYGDMSGGFAVLKDVPKTLVYKLARYRNELEGKSIIPENCLKKPPSAELKPDQTDQDILPPYPLLDEIIHFYVEEDRSYQEIVEFGYPKEIVQKVILMIDRSEYKRRQGTPGIKITSKAFGKDRRLPITNRYRIFCQ